MAAVARTRRRDVVLKGHGSLMYQCLVAGLPVASSCAGRGACGKCVVSILEGAEALSPPDSREGLVLVRIQAEPGARLSCQCRIRRPGAAVVITTGYW